MSAIASPKGSVEPYKGLEFSKIPQEYKQICPITADANHEIVINIILNIVKITCAVKDPAHGKYLLSQVSQQRFELTREISKVSTLILGCDIERGVFYSKVKDPLAFYRMMWSLSTPLTDEQYATYSPNPQTLDRESRENFAKLIKIMFRFAPPEIACDALETKASTSTPHTKCVPPFAEPQAGARYLETLVRNNKGLHLGHDHRDIESIADLLADKMPLLSSWGVKHVYLEYPAGKLHQQFTLFNSEKQHMSKERNRLLSLLKGFNVHKPEAILKICTAARNNNIEVWPVDLSCGDLRQMTSREIAITQRQGAMTKNINYYSSSKLKENEKFVSLLGENHRQVSNTLGIPSIQILSLNPKSTMSDEIINFGKQLIGQLSSEDVAKSSSSSTPQKTQVDYKAVIDGRDTDFDVFLLILPGATDFSLLPKNLAT